MLFFHNCKFRSLRPKYSRSIFSLLWNTIDNSWLPKLSGINDVKIRNLIFTRNCSVNNKLTETETVKLSNKRLKFLSDPILNHLATLLIQLSANQQAKDELYALYTPTYKTIGEKDTDTGKVFEVGVYIENECFGTGKGTNLKEARLSATEQALKNLEVLNKYTAFSTNQTESVANKKGIEDKLSNQIRQTDAPIPLATEMNAKNTIYHILRKYNLTAKYSCLTPINSPVKRIMLTANGLILGIGEADSKTKGERKAAMNALNNKNMLEYLRTYTTKK